MRHQTSAGLGVLEGVLRAEGVEYRYLDAWLADEWPDPRLYAGVLVLGGEMGIADVDAYAWLREVRRLVEDAVDAGAPLLGICLGAQTLASVLGADVGRAAVREVGFSEVTATAAGRGDPVVRPFANGTRVFQWHEDAFELPTGATLLYSGNRVANQAFRYGRCYGVQFHFEVDERIIAAWCDESDPDILATVWGTSKSELMTQAKTYLAAQRAAAVEATRAFVALAAGDEN